MIYETEPAYVYEGTGDIAVTGASLTNAGTMFTAPSAKTSSSASLSGVPEGAQLVKPIWFGLPADLRPPQSTRLLTVMRRFNYPTVLA